MIYYLLPPPPPPELRELPLLLLLLLLPELEEPELPPEYDGVLTGPLNRDELTELFGYELLDEELLSLYVLVGVPVE